MKRRRGEFGRLCGGRWGSGEERLWVTDLKNISKLRKSLMGLFHIPIFRLWYWKGE